MTKTTNNPALEIPVNLRPFADANFYDSHRGLSDRLVTPGDWMRKMRESGGFVQYHDSVDDSIGYVDLQPKDGYEQVVVSELPFANDWALNQFIRHRIMQKCALPGARFIIFPNNNLSQQVYSFNPVERQKVAAGDFSPLAQKQLRVLEDGLELSEFQVMGVSQGAAIGASLMRLALEKGDLQLGNSLLVEAPNVADRSNRQLKQDFMASGLGDFNKAVNNSGLPALSEVQHSRGGLDTLSQFAMFTNFGLSSLITENRALHSGMSQPTFFDDLEAVAKHTDAPYIAIVRAERSQIMPQTALEDLPDDSKVNAIQVPGYGHEVTDNVACLALLAKVALSYN